MHKRFLATSVLAVALLFNQGSNLLIASLCPHLTSGLASCETQVSQPAVSHEHMGHMQMQSMEPEPRIEQNTGGNALGQPMGECTHCAVHSRTTSNAVSLRGAEAAKRSIDLSIPLTCWSVLAIAASPAATLISRAHGPPGYQCPRHILINTFRI
jgi:hypothetical protein